MKRDGSVSEDALLTVTVMEDTESPNPLRSDKHRERAATTNASQLLLASSIQPLEGVLAVPAGSENASAAAHKQARRRNPSDDARLHLRPGSVLDL